MPPARRAGTVVRRSTCARRCVRYLQRSRDAMTIRAREMRVSRSSAMLRGCTNRDVGSLLRIRKTVRAEGV
jgi:hypothetical protein